MRNPRKVLDKGLCLREPGVLDIKMRPRRIDVARKIVARRVVRKAVNHDPAHALAKGPVADGPHVTRPHLPVEKTSEGFHFGDSAFVKMRSRRYFLDQHQQIDAVFAAIQYLVVDPKLAPRHVQRTQRLDRLHRDIVQRRPRPARLRNKVQPVAVGDFPALAVVIVYHQFR